MSKFTTIGAAAIAALITAPAFAGGESMDTNMFNHKYEVRESIGYYGYEPSSGRTYSEKKDYRNDYNDNYDQDKSFKENVKGKYRHTKHKVKNKTDGDPRTN